MHVDTLMMTPDNAAEAPRSRRRTRADRFDRRTAHWRRRVELIAIYVRALGLAEPPDGALAVKIESAAEMRTIAEVARARCLAGEDVSLDDVVRAENMAGRLEKALHLPSADAGPRRPTLDAYLAALKPDVTAG